MFLRLIVAVTALISCGNTASLPELPKVSFLNGRVVGGEKTTIDLHPHQVILQAYVEGAYTLFCGGSIISENYVLTAGHCVNDFAKNPKLLPLLTIRSGTSFPTQGGTIHETEAIVQHENYTLTGSGNAMNDIGLIRTKLPFRFDETRQPIELYRSDDEEEEEEIETGTVALVTGYGSIDVNNTQADQLQVVSVPIVNITDCNEAYIEYGGVNKGEICAGYLSTAGKDACIGDSGGPLTIGGQVAGIVSYGIGCADPLYPGVYASVSYFYDWIVENEELDVD